MKFLFYLIIPVFLLTSCLQDRQKGYLIEGNIKSLDDSLLYVVTQNQAGSDLKIDTIFVKNGHFSYKGQSDSLSAVVIYMNDGTVWTTVWAENDDQISVSGDTNYPELIMAKGNSINNILTSFKEQNKNLLKESRDLTDRKNMTEQYDTLSMEVTETQYISKLTNINHQLKENAEDFISNHPNSVASLILLQDYVIDPDDSDNFQKYLLLIDGDAIKSPLYEKLSDLNEKYQKTSIGASAPDFTLSDINNNAVGLGLFKGKYLLLTFATSSCYPCVKENNEFVDIRKKFNDDKLGMLTISLDAHKSTWIDVVKKNHYSWNQVIDTFGWDADIVSLYNVTSVPANFLLNEEGVIIAKNMSIDSLNVLLNEKLNQ